MLVPLTLLALGAAFAGLLYHGPFLEPQEGAEFWAGSLAFDANFMEELHHVPLWVQLSPGVVMLLGLLIAYSAYIRDTSLPGRFVTHMLVLYASLMHKWYFSEISPLLFVRPH